MKKVLAIMALAMLMVLVGCTAPGTNVKLSVYVYDQLGNPVENASVNVYSNIQVSQNTNLDWRNISGTVSASSQTNKDGRFETDIPAGRYSVQAGKANADGEWVYEGTTESFNDPYEGVSIRLDLSPAEPQKGSVKMEVSDYFGKPAKDGIEIYLYNQNGQNNISAITKNGIAYWTDLPFGEYSAYANNSMEPFAYSYNGSTTIKVNSSATYGTLSVDYIKGINFIFSAKDASYGNPVADCDDHNATSQLLISLLQNGEIVKKESYSTTNNLQEYGFLVPYKNFISQAKMDVNMSNDCYKPKSGHDVNVGNVYLTIELEQQGTYGGNQNVPDWFAYRAPNGTGPAKWEIKQSAVQTCLYTDCLRYPRWDYPTSDSDVAQNKTSRSITAISNPTSKNPQ